MSDKVKTIKAAMHEGAYDWQEAIETTAEKIVLLDSLEMF